MIEVLQKAKRITTRHCRLTQSILENLTVSSVTDEVVTKRANVGPTVMVKDGDMIVSLIAGINNNVGKANGEVEATQNIHQLSPVDAVSTFYSNIM